MYYEVKIRREKEEKKGHLQNITEQFITDAELFANAEYNAMQLYNGECDVISIRRSKVIELVNDLNDGRPVFKAVICQKYDIDGKSKERKYSALLSAMDVEDANKIAADYIKAGLDDMTLKGIFETNILGLI